MAYIGKTPASAALTSSDISDGIISTAKIADDAATADKIANAVNSAITANTSKTTNATHSGEVTGSGALTIAGNVVDEANLKVSNSPTNGYMLTAQSGNTGGLTWQEAGGGKIGQVIQTFKNDTASISATTFADISGMTAAITPSASSSKVLVFVNVVIGTNSGATTTSVRLLRGSTVIGAGASAGGSRTLGIIQSVNANNYTSLNSSTSFLDSPSSTSANTYKLQWRVNDSQTSYLNRGYSDGTDAGKTRTASTITLMEILA